jgi:rhamnosyltransferase
MRRAAIYFIYDAEGRVDEYVIYLLEHLRPSVEHLLVVSNTPIAADSRERLSEVADDVLVRANNGYDVWAYKEGIERIGWDRLPDFDELLLLNYTFFGPIHPFEDLFAQTDSWDVDFWGLTEHDSVRPHPFLAKSEMPRHIQSHWIAVRRTLFMNPQFRKYWREMPEIRSYNDSIEWHESRFTAHFDSLGFSHKVVYPVEDYPSRNPVFDNAVMLLDNGCPILKRRNLFHDPLYLDRYAILGRDMLDRAEAAGYPVDLILSNLARSAEPRVLVTNASLTEIIPPHASAEVLARASKLRIVAIVHIFYPEMTDEIVDRLDFLPDGYDLVVTTGCEASKDAISALLLARGRSAEIRVASSNNGRDISAFLVDCADVLRSGDYDLVVKLHSKKSVQDNHNAAELFKRHLFENLFFSSGHVANVLDLFIRHPSLGMVFPPVPHMGYPTIGHSWFANKEPAQEFAKKIGITVPFDASTPVAPYGSMFIARPEALRPFVQTGLTTDDFPAEREYSDGSLAHVIERLFAYGALSQGFHCRAVLTPRWASIYYGYLEYKLQNVSSMLPAYAIDQAPYLESRLGAVPNLLGVVKTNIMLRTPKMGNALKPAYRFARAVYGAVRGIWRRRP